MLQEFRCAAGHSEERLVRRGGGTSSPCSTCGAPATPSSVHRIAVGGRKWASEFEMPHDMRDAHEQAMGATTELAAAADEARGNGWTG